MPVRALMASGGEILTEGELLQSLGHGPRLQRSVPRGVSPEEHLRRLQADVDAVLTLQLHNFSDEAWGPLAEALVEYGFAVLRAWIASGQIFTELARTRSFAKLSPPPAGWMTAEEAQSIAAEVVTLALAAFKDDVLRQGRWDASKGASLSTFFVGQCKLQFPNVYRRWETQERRARSWEELDPQGVHLHGRRPEDPSASVQRDVGVEALLGSMSPRAAEVFWMKFVEGRSYEEIASLLPAVADAKTAENLVYRERKRWREGKAQRRAS